MDDLAHAQSLFCAEMYTLVRWNITKRIDDGIEGGIGLAVATAVDPMPNATDQQPVGENLEPASYTAWPRVRRRKGLSLDRAERLG